MMMVKLVRSSGGQLLAASMLWLAAVAYNPAPAFASPCAGDCDTNAQLTTAEVLNCLNIALGRGDRGSCTSCDGNNDGAVGADEMIRSVSRLGGDCQPDFVNATTGVTRSAVEVTEALSIVDFGYISSFSISAAAVPPNGGRAAAGACIQCADGSSLNNYACTVSGNTSTLSAALVSCANRGVTRSGEVELSVEDPTFCNTCTIPLNVAGTQTLSNYSETTATETVDVAQTLTEAFTLTADGCRGAGLQDRSSTYNGMLRIRGTGSDASFTYEDFTAAVSSTNASGLCAVTSTQSGTVRVNDVASNRRFVQTGDLVVTETTEADGDRTATINTPTSKTFAVDCLGGPVMIQTQQALLLPAGAACPTAGLLEVKLASSTQAALVRYTEGGGLAFDFNGDGHIDQSVTSCLDALVSQCRVDLPRPTSTEPVTLVVDGRSNIFGAGHSAPPSPGGGGGGILPPNVNFSASVGQVATFTGVTGAVTGWAGRCPENGPDGDQACGTATNVASHDGISGIRHVASTMFLVGVFLDDTSPSEPAPFVRDSEKDDVADVFPLLRQTFFIGDGKTSSGTTQRFHVPPTATRLFLGFAETLGFSGGTPASPSPGLPGYYDDNGGQVTASFAIASDARSVAAYILNGSAVESDGKVRLTPAAQFQKGSMWRPIKEQVAGGFQTSFEFQITDQGTYRDDFTGADGFAFVIQNEGVGALGGFGGAIGYASGDDGPGIAASLAVEFDTWDNSLTDTRPNGDPNDNHISVQTRGRQPNSAEHVYSLGQTMNIPNMSDGNVHTVRIQYVPATMKVFLDDIVNPALIVALDLSNILSLDDGRAWVGFTAATGGAWENHHLFNWSFASAQQSLALPVVWRGSPVSTSCTGPSDGAGHTWTAPAFDDSSWTGLSIPDDGGFDGSGTDRFYRGRFELPSPMSDIALLPRCDDGCEVYVNGVSSGRFGNGTCHMPGCVNLPDRCCLNMPDEAQCVEAGCVPPQFVSRDNLVAGPNVVAVHVSNGGGPSHFDMSVIEGAASTCGNCLLDPGEECDPSALRGSCAAGKICAGPGRSDACTCTESGSEATRTLTRP